MCHEIHEPLIYILRIRHMRENLSNALSGWGIKGQKLDYLR